LFLKEALSKILLTGKDRGIDFILSLFAFRLKIAVREIGIIHHACGLADIVNGGVAA